MAVLAHVESRKRVGFFVKHTYPSNVNLPTHLKKNAKKSSLKFEGFLAGTWLCSTGR